ncbi:MAG: bifunctional riboflavin kinase/FAD synthetase [Phocaeicola sp.]|uniref:bifunctional riboflavin kinase/FAD synthetase n=1 Tax=Phocaeicola sp. TaxID=2773926 RepID=UPI003FA06EDF
MDIVTGNSGICLSESVGTIGFFDGVHRGHCFLLDQVRNLAKERQLDSSVITFEVHPRKVLQSDYQPELLTTPEEKYDLLAVTGVQHCIWMQFSKELSLLSAFDFMKLLHEKYHISALVIGYDHRFGHNRSEGFEDYYRYGQELKMEVVCAKEFDSEGTAISSSVIRKLLKEGKITQANKHLGYNYFLTGTVVEGRQIGRGMGFPTANIQLNNSDKLIPGDGVYASYVYLNDRKYKGMLNIGNRPTIQNGKDRSIEVNILDFSGEIYRQPLRVELVKYLREERKYPDISGLVEQMKKDREVVSHLLDV